MRHEQFSSLEARLILDRFCVPVLRSQFLFLVWVAYSILRILT
jgi:hypothetical protein